MQEALAGKNGAEKLSTRTKDCFWRLRLVDLRLLTLPGLVHMRVRRILRTR